MACQSGKGKVKKVSFYGLSVRMALCDEDEDSCGVLQSGVCSRMQCIGCRDDCQALAGCQPRSSDAIYCHAAILKIFFSFLFPLSPGHAQGGFTCGQRLVRLPSWLAAPGSWGAAPGGIGWHVPWPPAGVWGSRCSLFSKTNKRPLVTDEKTRKRATLHTHLGQRRMVSADGIADGLVDLARSAANAGAHNLSLGLLRGCFVRSEKHRHMLPGRPSRRAGHGHAAQLP